MSTIPINILRSRMKANEHNNTGNWKCTLMKEKNVSIKILSFENNQVAEKDFRKYFVKCNDTQSCHLSGKPLKVLPNSFSRQQLWFRIPVIYSFHCFKFWIKTQKAFRNTLKKFQLKYYLKHTIAKSKFKMICNKKSVWNCLRI